jgi:hypothetical protein
MQVKEGLKSYRLRSKYSGLRYLVKLWRCSMHDLVSLDDGLGYYYFITTFRRILDTEGCQYR